METAFVQVSVIVLNRNNALDTLDCLKSLVFGSLSSLHLIVVDNASDDGSAQVIAAAYPQAEMVVAPRNLGYAGGMNFGISWARQSNPDYLLLLNNDTVIAADAVAQLIDAAEQYRDAGVFIPKIYFASRHGVIWSAGAEWRRFPPRVTMRGLNHSDGPEYDRPAVLDYATGCAMLVRPAIFERGGWFDEGYFMYQDDYDFCYRCRRAGWSIRYVPAARVWHKVSMGLGSKSPRWWYYWGRGTVRFYLHTLRYSRFAFTPVLGWLIAREIVKGHVQFIRPLLAGVWDETRNLKAAGRHV